MYSAYSSMKLGSSVLGLHREGYLQLLKDAGMVEGRCVCVVGRRPCGGLRRTCCLATHAYLNFAFPP